MQQAPRESKDKGEEKMKCETCKWCDGEKCRLNPPPFRIVNTYEPKVLYDYELPSVDPEKDYCSHHSSLTDGAACRPYKPQTGV